MAPEPAPATQPGPRLTHSVAPVRPPAPRARRSSGLLPDVILLIAAVRKSGSCASAAGRRTGLPRALAAEGALALARPSLPRLLVPTRAPGAATPAASQGGKVTQ
ncbi:unnamed protein product [Coccothraustes coccothraustes]